MRQQERSERTRRKIMLASVEEFGSRSYTAASVNSICERGDLPKGLIYHYFRSKEELYLACMKEMMDGLIQRLESRLEESTEEGESAAAGVFQSQRGLFQGKSAVCRLLQKCYGRVPAAVAAGRENISGAAEAHPHKSGLSKPSDRKNDAVRRTFGLRSGRDVFGISGHRQHKDSEEAGRGTEGGGGRGASYAVGQAVPLWNHQAVNIQLTRKHDAAV